jgi:filamentous hemagglutinin
MNKNLHRIVFNARRGLRMAVAETAVSQGKSASGEGGSAFMGVACSRALWTVRLAAGLVLLGGVLASPVDAQIVADRSAPGNQQATILGTASGVTQVNIQTPSAAGVSRNTYSQFDVTNKGAILNNSRTDASTQIGGYVQGNPWLATGGARVILNEVNASAASQLRGYVEVAGQRAEVIIANPAGIAVNGGGFLNASAVTLTTGTAVMNAGGLDSFKVRGGSVTVDGAGLDTSTADYTNILARAVQVNAGIWAKDLKVLTGANDIGAVSSATPTVMATATGTGAAPGFALGVAALGGMYAGKIYLVGTEAGLGVRNGGVIGASATASG